MSRSSAKQLWIIDPSLETPETQGVQTLRDLWDGDVRLFQPCLEGEGPKVSDGYGCDGLVVLGSACSVHEMPAPLVELASWLRPIVHGDVRRPALGVCFGHQLFAHLRGASVEFNETDHSKRVGIENSRFSGSALIADDRELRVIVSHREQVTSCPEGWRDTARRPGVSFDGIECPAFELYSYQFHPEARDEFAERAGMPVADVDERLRADSNELIRSFLARIK